MGLHSLLQGNFLLYLYISMRKEATKTVKCERLECWEIYEVCLWGGLSWHDKPTKSFEDRFRHSSNIKFITSTIWRAGITLSVYWLATGWTTEGSEFESLWGQEFSPLHIVQTCSGVHPTSYSMGTGGSFPRVKRSGREVYHSPSTSAEVKKSWVYMSTPYTPSWRSA
jgi:hypothetical protein